MYPSDSKNNSGAILLTGMAIGAATALLLTPKNGKEIRAELQSRSDSAKRKLHQKKHESTSNMTEMKQAAEKLIP